MLGALTTSAALAGAGLWLRRRVSVRGMRAEAEFPPTGRILDVAGARVHALTEGSGPDLVLIHGASGNARDFTFGLTALLRDRYRVTAFDRPGLGWSGRGKATHDRLFTTAAESPAEQAALLQAASDQLGLRRPIVLGHSYGGAVALAWGLSRPSDTAALVLLSAVSTPWPGGLGAFYAITGSALGGAFVVPLLSALVPDGYVEASINEIFAPQSPPPGYSAHVGAPLTMRPAAMRANARQVGTLRRHIVEMAPRYSSLPMPVEIVHGQADTIVPFDIHAAPLARQIPGAHLTALPGIGHMPHHVAHDTVLEAIDRAAKRAELR